MSVYHVRTQVLDPQMGSVIFVCDFVDLRPHVFGVSSTGLLELQSCLSWNFNRMNLEAMPDSIEIGLSLAQLLHYRTLLHFLSPVSGRRIILDPTINK